MTDKEKIKAALRFCSDKPDNCIGCPVFSPDDISDCTSNVMNVAANIIDRLEAENDTLREKFAEAEKCAYAAVKCLCTYCTDSSWSAGSEPNCKKCEFGEANDKIFGGVYGMEGER